MVVSVCGGPDVGKSAIASLLAGMLCGDGINTYIMSGEVNGILAQFKSGKEKIQLKRMRRTREDIWHEAEWKRYMKSERCLSRFELEY